MASSSLRHCRAAGATVSSPFPRPGLKLAPPIAAVLMGLATELEAARFGRQSATPGRSLYKLGSGCANPCYIKSIRAAQCSATPTVGSPVARL
jgi:hypothetical protein